MILSFGDGAVLTETVNIRLSDVRFLRPMTHVSWPIFTHCHHRRTQPEYLSFCVFIKTARIFPVFLLAGCPFSGSACLLNVIYIEKNTASVIMVSVFHLI